MNRTAENILLVLFIAYMAATVISVMIHLTAPSRLPRIEHITD